MVLEAKTWSYARQDNVALIKTQLGRFALQFGAPSRPISPKAWIFRLAGAIYLGWQGNTLEEPVWMEMGRLEDTS